MGNVWLSHPVASADDVEPVEHAGQRATQVSLFCLQLTASSRREEEVAPAMGGATVVEREGCIQANQYWKVQSPQAVRQ